MRAKRWVSTGLAAAGFAALVVPVLMLVGASPAFACSCVPFTQQEYLDRADAVFAGTLVDRQEPPWGPVRSSMDPATLTFQVSGVYKGKVYERQEVTTAQSGASCGLEIEGEGPFLVFANLSQTGDGLTAGLCGGTDELAEVAPPSRSAAPPSGAPLAGSSPSMALPDTLWPVVGAAAMVLGLVGWLVARRFRTRSGS